MKCFKVWRINCLFRPFVAGILCVPDSQIVATHGAMKSLTSSRCTLKQSKHLQTKLFKFTVQIHLPIHEPAMRNHLPPAVESITPQPAPEYDTPWKIAVEQHFEAFMAFFFPTAHARIDWSFQHEFLDKELQAIAKDAVVGKRHVDKLIKVRTKAGTVDWLCIHLEIQVSRQAKFAERMFIYHYRIFDFYGKPAASMALLGDGSATWMPCKYAHTVMDCKLDFEFPVVKLLHYAEQEASLETDPNPFALLTLAYLKNRATTTDMAQRYEVKCKLVRSLLARQWAPAMIRQFFLAIDWMMVLPPELTSKLATFINELEEEQRMEYVS